jgi:hypothetical protein
MNLREAETHLARAPASFRPNARGFSQKSSSRGRYRRAIAMLRSASADVSSRTATRFRGRGMSPGERALQYSQRVHRNPATLVTPAFR